MTTAIIYTRQSKHRDESITHELQEQACRTYAAQHGYGVVTVLNERGKSGTSIAKRKEFQSAVKMIEDGKAQVMIIWRWSRFARNTLDGLITLKSVEEEAGGRVECATEPIDRSAMGRFSLTMMLGMAEMESAVKGEQWKEALDYRIAQGLPPGGRRYWGYDRIKDDQGERYVQNDYAPLIREGMERIVAGHSMRSVTHWLNGCGVRTALGRTIYPNKIRDMYTNPFLRGRINWRNEEVQGAHEPIITEGLYSKFLSKVQEHKEAPRRDIPAHRLVGIIFCAKCGKRMSYYAKRKDRPNSVPIFRCASRAAKGPGECDGGQLKVSAIEDALLWWMPRHQADIEKAAPKEDDLSEQIADKDAEADRLQGKLTQTLTIGTEAGLTPAQMTDALSVIRGQLEAVRTEADALRNRVVISQRLFWDIEDIVHGDDVLKARETLKKIIRRIDHDDVAQTLTFIPTVGDPYVWSLKGGPRSEGGWSNFI